MNIYIIILIEFLFVAASILLLFRLRSKLGLAPLYLLLGSVKYLLNSLSTTLSFNFFGEYVIYPGSVVLFSAVLFAVLLIYIKEGVSSARTLIVGIIISNFVLTVLFDITYAQDLIMSNATDINLNSAFIIDYKYFIIGNVLLLLDFFLIVILYQYLILNFKRLHFFLIIFISLFSVLIFDAIIYNIAKFYGTPYFINSMISHIIGKSISSLIFSIILYVYLTFLDKEKNKATFIANQERNIFSILTYRKKYFNLKVEKNVIEQKLTSQLETTLNNISDGFISLDTNWCYIYVNGKACEYLGRTPSNILGKNIWTEFPEKAKQPLYNVYHKAAETQETQYYIEYSKLLDKWYERRIYPSPEGLTIYITDITKQKKAEGQIIKNEKYLNNILNNIGDPIFVKDDQSKILLVNNAFREIFNIPEEDIIGKSLIDDVPPEERDNFLSIDKQVLDSGIENVNEETFTFRELETRVISTKKSRFLDDAGNKFLIGTIRDITERKKAEIAIKESEEKFSKAFESKVIGKAILNNEKRIIEINEALTNILGYKREDMLGKTAEEIGFFKLDNERNQENEKMLWTEFDKNGYTSNVELNYKMHSGKDKFLLISFQRLKLVGENHILITVLDITEKKNAEQELEQYRNNLENLVKTRTEEVNLKNAELQRMNKLFVGRELKMKELKNIIKELKLKIDN
ncbi:PAS domain S-box-containing protein [Mariniflexile fucanivorans]|uniref:PAS domain S-box-containing protein n=1 Tax=Mariniflexile fucanivorans TaxID=264023 RepID=A0A4R1RHN3_9FLAO|nr:PAS domain-containing protein [Mariniflexile fucanivorans]TCL65102.1 PAS domain S-box-containing protein [Mariniflexile fucanivorans]